MMIHFNGPEKHHRYPVERFLESELNCRKVILTPSCTAALEMSALLLDIQPSDEIILPSFTFPSTANAFVLRGAMPVFCDIREDTLNLDEKLLPDLITSKTKAIVLVHYGGVACNMDSITSFGVLVIEDNAHGLFGSFKGQPLGTIGELGCLSFHHTKNYSCGEGGALLINDESLIERAEILRDKGTNRQSFMRGEVAKYEWVDIGSSFVMSDILTKGLYTQLRSHFFIQSRRLIIWVTYKNRLSQWMIDNGVRHQRYPLNLISAFHLFCLILPTVEFKTGLQQHLLKNGIQALSHFQPLHSSPYGKQWPASCPVTDDISQRLLRLPMYDGLTEKEQIYIIETVKSYGP